MVLSANVVAAAVILWAADPAAAGGVGGLLASALAGLLLTVPVSFGAIVLLHRWQASDLPWKEWFKNENFRPTLRYGIVAGAAGFVATVVLAAWLDDWLAGAYPAASAVPTMGIQVPALAILGLLVLANPSDRRSALQAIAAAAVLLETAFAGSIMGGLVAVTLQSNGFWLIIFDLVPLIPVLAGAVLLVARKPDGRQSSDQDAGSEEDAPA